ncbi:MAG TPA: LysM peptidoglycan-binding domain-containing protein, partial [Acidimicrobiales bacterium]
MLIAAALTTVIAVAALLVLSRDDSGAGDPRPERDGPSQYTVREGDTLTAVADLHDLPVADLMDALGLTLADSLEPGDVLEIPAIPVDGHEWPHRLVEDPIRAQQNIWFERWAAEYHVPTSLLQALAWNISSWDNTTVSGDGDMGIGRIDLELVGWINEELIDDDARVDPR